MNRAVCLVRDPPHYRRDAILAGLKAAGAVVVPSISNPVPGDCLVIWNRYGNTDKEARRFEATGAAVILVENGYVGHHDNEHGKPVAANGEQLYAMALNRHNGAGTWFVGSGSRWREQGIQVKPWREGGEHILLLAQRGIGTPPVASPRDWPERTERRLRKLTDRPIKVRGHPGNQGPVIPLESDLAGAWCAVTWASSAGIRAICAGVPVFSDFEQWIGAPAVLQRFEQIEEPLCDDSAREDMLGLLSWAQWTVSEIASGDPFLRLMEVYEGRADTA